MPKPASTLGKFFYGLAKLYRGFRAVVLNLLFLLVVFIIVASLVGQPPVIVQRGSALLLNPNGILVDQLTYVDPLSALMADSLDTNTPREVLLQDVLDAISHAATDDDISAIVLVPDSLQASGFSKLQEIGQALTRFRESGKKVYAYGDNFSQGQYYLAAHADEIILNGMGGVNLEGFSSYQYYFADALEKLGINVHIFRVGEYKSAVEPFERMDMSTEAQEANTEWLGDLWQHYVNDVSAARNLDPAFIPTFINTLDTQLVEFGGNATSLALERGLVDLSMSRTETNEYLKQVIGTGPNSIDFLNIDYRSYLAARAPDVASLQTSNDEIGIIVASGTIYDGTREAGEIGGDSLQRLIRQARDDENIKAVVLRIDSGGGSAFASEIIRTALLDLKNAGKPLVVSMGSVAASGGYWIATPADEIWASSTTITGSIGIFGLYPTFEESFNKLGLNADGVGTTDLAGALTPGRELPPLAANVLQLQLQDGYNRFINLVADARNMPFDEVDSIARGRVWSGEDAFDLGLVDKLGNLNDAIDAAAVLAGLGDFNTRIIEQPLSPGQQLLQDLTGSAMVKSWVSQPASTVTTANVLGSFYRTLNRDLQGLLKFNDPDGLYLQCQECRPALSP